MSYRYYSTQRPVMPGSYPKPENNKVEEICNFDNKTYSEEIQTDAWGYIEYEKPLGHFDIVGYGRAIQPQAGRILQCLLQKRGKLSVNPDFWRRQFSSKKKGEAEQPQRNPDE